MTAEAKQLSFGEVLALRPVRQLWIAQIVSIFGDFLALFAVLSDVSFRLHATAAQVTLITRNEQEESYREIAETDAWSDDDGYAHYVLRCVCINNPA